MMFREKSISKFYAFTLAGVFALTLAGCGGSGGGSAMMDMDEEMPTAVDPVDPEPTPEEIAAQEEMDALTAAQEAAMTAATAAMAAVGSAVDPVASGNAYKYAAMAQSASDAAAEATTSAMALGHQTAAEAARDSAMGAGGMTGLGIVMLSNKPLNGDDIENAELSGTEAPKPANNAKNVGAAIGAAGDSTTADTGFTNQGGVSDSTDTQLTIGAVADNEVAAHKAGGSTFAVQFGAEADTRLLAGETASRFNTKGGWEAQDLLLPDAEADSELKTHLVVSTDIQGDAVTPSYGENVTLTDGNIITGVIPGDGKDFEGTFDVSATDNIPPMAGRFHCPAGSADGCSISADDKGAIIRFGSYVFQPLVSATGTKTVDADYLAWGFWVQASIRDSGPTATNVDAQAGAFAYGNVVFNVLAELKGSATYNGVANGLYSAAGMVDYFDADVTLEANFGGNAGADNTPGSAAAAEDNDGLLIGAVTGTVSNIRAGGMEVEGMLTLKRAKVIAGDIDGASEGGFTGATEGTVGSELLKGMWGGQFYGPNKATTAAAMETEFPTTAAGTFNATGGGNTPMSLLGAFGSWKAE